MHKNEWNALKYKHHLKLAVAYNLKHTSMKNHQKSTGPQETGLFHYLNIVNWQPKQPETAKSRCEIVSLIFLI